MNKNTFAILSRYNENEIEKMISQENNFSIIKNNYNILSSLFPNEIWNLIFSFLNLQYFGKLMMVSKFFSFNFFSHNLIKCIELHKISFYYLEKIISDH